MESRKIKNFMWRHRFAVRDLSFILAGLLLALYGVYAFDVFQAEGQLTAVEARIELDEALLVGAGLGVALLGFGARQYLLQRREMRRRIAAERHARELAYQDGLTGLPNRRQFAEALAKSLDTPPGTGRAHGVFMLDLNGFKQINDVHGHGVGDEVLVVVGQRLRAAMRGSDLVARFGGDEFAVLAMHLAGAEAATNVGLRVIEALSRPIEAGGAVHSVGAGIGIALVPADAQTLDEAMRKADIALYRAKTERRSALRFFEEEMDARVRGRAAMEVALRDALETGRIETVYQPTIDLGSHEVVGFEAVPRWIDPVQGEIPRERFIAIAEETGLIHALAERTLLHALGTARGWPAHVSLAVDVYPGQLRDRLLPARILRLLVRSEFSPSRLEVEIAENALVADVEGAKATLAPLREAGVRIALDNFGTGYSSLYHLRNFGIDKIKIDRSFVQAMATERESASIVNALVGLGQGFGLTIAAEGVDASAHAASLLSTGCEQGQGRLFSAPITAEQTASLFADIDSGTFESLRADETV